MYAVGLTGGIGSGKSTVAAAFAALGAGVVDTDVVAHQLTGPGQPATRTIATNFGPQFLAPNGALDRARMRKLVFADPAARKRLEALLHPLIRDECQRQVATSGAHYVLVVVPLLFETGSYLDKVRRTLAVDCDPETQVQRVMARSQLTREEVLAIMATQVSRQARLQAADDVIVNDQGLDLLHVQVGVLHARYLAAAHNDGFPA
ncbi:MAG: dephospho-CoA kinase [Burkholderiales bacterium]